MKHSTRGIPILTMDKKSEALAYCIKEGANEDAAGHLCDLLAHIGSRLASNPNFRFRSMPEIVEYYGFDPTPIDEERVTPA